jgi:hypothetical protein
MSGPTELDPIQQYACRRAAFVPEMAGKLDDGAWRLAPWSPDFVDIEGSAKPIPRYRTRMKMLWDNDRLYFGAELFEPHIWATLREKNSIIFQDNDFEIFIDPDSDSLNYYEFEINAFNTIMELTMDKPYCQKGNYTLGTNLPGLRSAVHVEGTLNDPSDQDRAWIVEVSIPWADLKRFAGVQSVPPNPGDVWRMNFSRVQWRHEVVAGRYVKVPKELSPEDNWVWSPIGVVDMHQPHRWGHVIFED